MNFTRVFDTILDIIPAARHLLGDPMKSSSAMKSLEPEPSLSTCSLAELEAQITELAGQLNAANYRWLTLIAEFDRRNGWADGKLPSCAHWLNFKCGLAIGAAREKGGGGEHLSRL